MAKNEKKLSTLCCFLKILSQKCGKNTKKYRLSLPQYTHISTAAAAWYDDNYAAAAAYINGIQAAAAAIQTYNNNERRRRQSEPGQA